MFQPFGGFADGVPIENGYVRVPDVPGIGFEAKTELVSYRSWLVSSGYSTVSVDGRIAKCDVRPQGAIGGVQLARTAGIGCGPALTGASAIRG